MGYKKFRVHIDKKGNKLTQKQVADIKREYAEEHLYCECCNGKSSYFLSIHHHIKQRYKYHGDEYALEFPDNYSLLCQDCHQQIHASSNQYERNNHSKPKEYWETLKNGQEPSFYVREYLRDIDI